MKLQRGFAVLLLLLVAVCRALESESGFEGEDVDMKMSDSPVELSVVEAIKDTSRGTEEELPNMLRRQEYDEEDMKWKNLLAPTQSTLGSMLAYHSGEVLRRLVGSNCVLIERGTVTKYYMCVGCEVEEAMGCVDDMRQNKSGNVRAECQFDHVMEGNMANVMEQEQQAACCPTVVGGTLAAFAGSAYPEAFRCIANVGCVESTIMSQLMEECHGLCDYVPSTGDDASVASYTGNTICLAGYAAAPKAMSLSIATVITVVIACTLSTIL